MNSRQSLTPKEDYMAPRWSRDGLDVLVTKGKYKGLYLVSSYGEDVRQISDEPGIGYNARWSADGNYIIVEGEDGLRYYDRSGQEVDSGHVQAEPGPSIYAKDGVVYRRGGTARSEADDVVMMDEDQYFEPVESPDGAKIAYIGLESGIVIKDLETGEDVYIGLGTDISWLPDGSGIIFNYTQDDGEEIIDGEIYFASVDGSTVENLTNTAYIIERHPNLSWDSSQLTYEVDGQIYSVEVDIR
jgi:Tol biopolymer transport system component